jgi:hypothetical protein
MGQENLNGRMSVAVAKNWLVSCMGLKGPPKMALVAFHSFVLCNGAIWLMRHFARKTRYRYMGAMRRQ